MKHFYPAFLTIVLGFFLVLGGLPSSYAQESDIDQFTLEEITVTAEKREENVQKVPVAVSIVTSEQISNKSLNSVQDILQNVVGVQMQGLGGAGEDSNSNIFIRGIGLNNLPSTYGDPAVALNVDGVQNQANNAIFSSMVDVERVEVLRGPQGTLYGRNATGGVVNVVMVQPKDYFEFYGGVQLGSYNARSFEGVVNVPVNSQLALRISGVKEKRDEYLEGGPKVPFHENDSYRMKARYNLNDNVTLTGTMAYSKVEETPFLTYIYPYSNLFTDNPWYNPDALDPGDRVDIKESWSYSFQLDWDIGDLTVFTFIPTQMINERQCIGEQVEAFMPDRYWKQTQYSYEARFANAEDSKLTWVLGGFYFDSESPMSEDITVSTEPTATLLQRPTGSWSIFAQSTYPATDRFRVVGGARYAYDDRSSLYRIYQTNDPAEGEDLVFIYDSGTQERKNVSKKITYKFGLEYDIAEDSMGYIQVATGYKAGGTSISIMPSEDLELRNLGATQFDPEKSMNFELGSKNRFLNNRLQLNGALFYTIYDSMQVQMPYMLNEGTVDEEFIMQVVNADASKMYGAELELSWLITAMDSLTVGVSSMKGEYGRLIATTGNPPGVTPRVQVARDLTGTQMANMPRFNLQLGYAHTWDLDNYGILKASLDTNYKTEYYNSVETFVTGALVPSHHISNIYLNWSSQSGIWSTSAFTKNLEDKAISLRAMGGGREMALNAPRTFGIKVTFKYQ